MNISALVTLNDLDNNLPKGRSLCFDIGIWGGCGISCPEFLDGNCTEPQEIKKSELINEYGIEETEEILSQYNIKDKI